jgi:hypothetical protein
MGIRCGILRQGLGSLYSIVFGVDVLARRCALDRIKTLNQGRVLGQS